MDEGSATQEEHEKRHHKRSSVSSSLRHTENGDDNAEIHHARNKDHGKHRKHGRREHNKQEQPQKSNGRERNSAPSPPRTTDGNVNVTKKEHHGGQHKSSKRNRGEQKHQHHRDRTSQEQKEQQQQHGNRGSHSQEEHFVDPYHQHLDEIQRHHHRLSREQADKLIGEVRSVEKSVASSQPTTRALLGKHQKQIDRVERKAGKVSERVRQMEARDQVPDTNDQHNTHGYYNNHDDNDNANADNNTNDDDMGILQALAGRESPAPVMRVSRAATMGPLSLPRNPKKIDQVSVVPRASQLPLPFALYVESVVFPMRFKGGRFVIAARVGGESVDLVVSTVRRSLSISAKTSKKWQIDEQDFVGPLLAKNCLSWCGPISFFTLSKPTATVNAPAVDPTDTKENNTDAERVWETEYRRFPYFVSVTGGTDRFGILGKVDESGDVAHLRLQSDRFLLIHGREPILCMGEGALAPPQVSHVPLLPPPIGKKPLIVLPVVRIALESMDDGRELACCECRPGSNMPAIVHYESPCIGLPGALYRAVRDQLSAASGLFDQGDDRESTRKISLRFRTLPQIRISFATSKGSTTSIVVYPRDYLRRRGDACVLALECSDEVDEETAARVAATKEEDDSEEDDNDRQNDRKAFVPPQASAPPGEALPYGAVLLRQYDKARTMAEFIVLGNCALRNCNFTCHPKDRRAWFWSPDEV